MVNDKPAAREGTPRDTTEGLSERQETYPLRHERICEAGPTGLFRRPGLARTAELGWRRPGSRLRPGQFRRREARGPAMSTSQ
jgi:hypothetical protein